MGKVDADAFADLMGSMINAPWLLDYQKEWPKYLFHTTHVENAARIVMDGKLLSRDLALQAGRLGHDTGNQSVLDHQSRHIAKHARLYFRPNTPALFHAEGIRPKGRYKSGSCPVPIAFLFDSAEVLPLDGSRFTNGNTASPKKCAFNSSAYQLAKLPFQLIYHDEGFSQGAGYITFHRHAEVLIPNALDLKSLKKICFRSPSELETFLTLL